MNKHDKEAHLRSILKAVSYRVLAGIATGSIAYLFTRRLDVSLGIALVEAVAKICCFYLHERLWSVISFGKGKHPLASIPIDKPIAEEDMKEIKKKLKELGYLDED